MKQLKIILFFLPLIILLGCQKNESTKIGVLLPHTPGREDIRWQKEAELFKQNANNSKGQAIIKKAAQDAQKQYNQAQELIQQEVDALIIVPVNIASAARIVREAHENDIKVLSYDRLISNAKPDYYLAFKFTDVGEKMVEYATKKIPEGNYVLLWGDRADNNALRLKNGQINTLDSTINSGKINIVYKTFVDNWSVENARHEMQQVLSLSNKEIDAVLGSNDRIAEGARKALTNHNITDSVLITGMDGDLSALRRIVRGEQAITFYHPINEMAKVALQKALQLVQGGSDIEHKTTVNNGTAQIPANMIKSILIDKNNLDEKIIEKGIYTKEQIYEN